MVEEREREREKLCHEEWRGINRTINIGGRKAKASASAHMSTFIKRANCTERERKRRMIKRMSRYVSLHRTKSKVCCKICCC